MSAVAVALTGAQKAQMVLDRQACGGRCPCERSRSRGKGLTHCLCHEDANPSMMVTARVGDDAPLLHCHAGCAQANLFAAFCELDDGWTPSTNGRTLQPVKHRGFADHRYQYLDDAGQLIATKLRWDAPKTFKWEPAGVVTADLLYGAELLPLHPGVGVLIVEGEKCADAARAAGIRCAVSGAGGANAAPSREALQDLAGRRVVLFPDDDEAGFQHMYDIAANLPDDCDVHLVDWPDAPVKGDVVDFLAAHPGDDLALKQLLRDAKPYVAPADPAPDALVLGKQVTTDIGNARRFVNRHGDDVRSVYKWRSYVAWDGMRWNPDGARVDRMAQETADSIWDEVKATKGKDAKARLSTWGLQSASSYRLDSMLRVARSTESIVVEPSQLDADGWRLNTPSGTVNLKTGILYPAVREDLITKLTAAPYDPNAECPLWLKFLGEVLPDPEVVAYVQQLIGYALTGEVIEHSLHILFGTGRNGKGVFTNTIVKMLGDYGDVTDPETFLARKEAAHPTNIADLHGKRLVASSETDSGRRLNEATVKNLTGGDIVKARRMREDPWSYIPTATMLLATNHLPARRPGDGRGHLVPPARRSVHGPVPRRAPRQAPRGEASRRAARHPPLGCRGLLGMAA